MICTTPDVDTPNCLAISVGEDVWQDGDGIEKIIDRVANLFDMKPGEVIRPAKQPLRE